MAVRFWVGAIGLAAIAAASTACTADSRQGEREKGENTGTARGALAAVTTQHVVWGDAQGQLGFRPGMREAMPMGAPAVAALPGGAVLVLDALHERVVRVQKNDVTEIAKVPIDCDDLAVAPDGAFAVRRSVRPEVIVFSKTGEKIGTVDTSAVPEADTIALGASRRVFVTNGYQQTFLVGSPSMPQLKAAVQASPRDGAALLPDGSGVVAVKHGDAVELRVVAPRTNRANGEDRTQTTARWSLGAADAARVVGVSNGVACARIEHVATDASGALLVKREAACLDLASGKTLLRRELPAAGAYAPRRELSFADGVLVFAHAGADGLDVTSFAVEGGVR